MHKQNSILLKTETMAKHQAINQAGAVYLRDKNSVFVNKVL